MILKTNGKEIQLNEEQVFALKEIKEFVRQNQTLFLCLSGSAGTGKTTIMKEGLRGLWNVAVSAPTHKAKAVISEMTGFDATTIHSLCGLRPDMNLEEFSQNNMVFSKTSAEKISGFELIVIDEASMLVADLVKLIKEKAKEFKVKILFIGDSKQLPPVKEKEGLVFVDKEIKQVKLIKVERQKDSNPLMYLYDKILSDIHSPVDLFEKITNKNNETNEGYEFFNQTKFFGEKMPDYFIHNTNENKILCFSNERVRQWNNYIRKIVVGNYQLPITVGEIIMGYNSVMEKNARMKLLFQNSTDYRVIDVRAGEKLNLKGWYVGIKNLYTREISKVFILQKDIENENKFLKEEQRRLAKAKIDDGNSRAQKWKYYYDYRNEIQLLGDIVRNQQVIIKKDFDYAYAITIHKSQGSTYENVFVDEKDIDDYATGTFRNSLKYVAFSRPTKMAFINSN